MRRLAAWALVGLLGLTSTAAGQTCEGARSGLFERWSLAHQAPVGSVTAAEAAALPRYLRVDCDAAVRRLRIVFEPEGRVVWHVRLGAHGPEAKDTLADGVLLTHTELELDTRGQRVSKTVTGPGLRGPLAFVYRDAGGPLERTGHIPADRHWLPDVAERVVIAADRVETWRDGQRVRLDWTAPDGRLLETRFGADGSPTSLTLRYHRSPAGRLRAVSRRFADGPWRSEPLPLTVAVVPRSLDLLRLAPVERWEVGLLFAPPTSHEDVGTGLQRRRVDHFSADACWLEESSYAEYDPSGLMRGVAAACICGG